MGETVVLEPRVDVNLLAPPASSPRQVGWRLLAAPALGQLGPFGLWTFPLVYLVLPLITAAHLRLDGREAFLREEVPRLRQGLGWVLAFQAWAMALVDRFPLPVERVVISLDVSPSSPPRAGTALLRLLTDAPAGLALWLAAAAAVPLWIASLSCLAVAGRQPRALRAPLCWLLGANARFLARHASLARRSARAG